MNSPTTSRIVKLRDLDPTVVAASIGALFAIGAVILAIHHGAQAGTSLLWSLACLGIGGFSGFLFGIPRTLQGDLPRPAGEGGAATGAAVTAPKTDSYHLQVNTNLEQISDWLTKILVGLGLTQLREIPAQLTRAAHFVAGGAGATDSDRAVAVALIIYFSVIGFIGGYLLTRLFLAGAFSRADQAAQRSLEDWIAQVDKEMRGIEASDANTVPTEKQMAAAQRVGVLSLDADQSLIRDQVFSLAREYERIRSAMFSGTERTQRMEVVVTKMRTLALAGYFLIPELQGSTSPGERLACIAFLQVKPDAACLDWLAERLASENEMPFVAYHAAVALRSAVQKVGGESLSTLKAALEKARAHLGATPANSDRVKTLMTAIAELDAKQNPAVAASTTGKTKA